MWSSSMTHCLQSSLLRKRYARKLENSFIKEPPKDHVLRSKQIRNVNHKIYPVKKQDHLGKHKAKCEASGRLDATSWTTESQTSLSQRFEQMKKNSKQSPSWSRSLNPRSTRNNFFEILARRRRSTGSVTHRKCCWKTWIKQKSWSSARTLKNFSDRTANPLQKLWKFVADANDLWGTIEVQNQTSIVILLMAIS